MTILSPKITPTVYDREAEGHGDKIVKVEYDSWRLVPSNAHDTDNVCEYGDGMLMFRDDIGSVYIGDGHAHVSDGMYRSHPVIFLQEFVATGIMHCKRNGVVDGVDVTKERLVYSRE